MQGHIPFEFRHLCLGNIRCIVLHFEQDLALPDHTTPIGAMGLLRRILQRPPMGIFGHQFFELPLSLLPNIT